MKDLIDRQAATTVPVKPREDRYFQTQSLDDAYDYGWRSLQRCIEKLPSAQPDAIPLEWIAKHLEWLDNCDNDFAQLAKVAIRAMVEIWKKEKT